MAVVITAREHNRLTAIRGGHGVADHATCDDRMKTDLSPMKGIHIDCENTEGVRMTINEDTLNALLGTMVTELGAAYVGASVILGDQLGLYQSLAANGSSTSAQLALRTGTVWSCMSAWPAA